MTARHLTEEEYMNLVPGKYSTAQKDHRALYKLIVTTWPSPSDWLNATGAVSERVGIASSWFYWIQWALLTETAVPVGHLRQLHQSRVIQSPVPYLEAVRAIDLAAFRECIHSYYSSEVMKRSVISLLLKQLLLSGKRYARDLTTSDLEEGEAAGIEVFGAALTMGGNRDPYPLRTALVLFGLLSETKPQQKPTHGIDLPLTGGGTVAPHLAEEEYLKLVPGRYYSAQREHRAMYQMIVSTWATPSEWLRAQDAQVLRTRHISSWFYWVHWALLTETPFPPGHLRQLHASLAINNPVPYLEAVGAVDTDILFDRIHSLYPSSKMKQKVAMLLLKQLLLSGKRRATDLTADDLQRGEAAGPDVMGVWGFGGKRDPYPLRTALTLFGSLPEPGGVIKKPTPKVLCPPLPIAEQAADPVVLPGHLLEEEFLALRGSLNPRERRRMQRLYREVVATWPTPQDWLRSNQPEFRFGANMSSWTYWILWALQTGTALPLPFLQRLRETGALKLAPESLQAVAAVDVSQLRKYVSDRNDGEAWRKVCILLVRQLLFSGKRYASELTTEDIDLAEAAGVTRNEKGTLLFRRALHSLGILPVPPRPRHRSFFAPQFIRRFPAVPSLVQDGAVLSGSLQQMTHEFVDVLSRSRSFAERKYKMNKDQQLMHFLTWWAKRSGKKCVDLQSMTRVDWVEYLRYTADRNLSGHTKACYAATLLQFLNWAWAEHPVEMPAPFLCDSEDYSKFVKDAPPAKSRTFESSEVGDVLIHHTLNVYRPTTAKETMLRAAVVFQGVTGARVSEVRHLAIGAYHWSEESNCYKAIIYRVDKMGRAWRPLLLAKEGYEALLEVEKLRRAETLLPVRDKRVRERYVHLFELDGKRIVNSNSINRFMNERKVEAGLVDSTGRPLQGTSHSWRHRFGRRVFEMSGGDIKVVQHLLGHVDSKMSEKYTQEDQARRNAKLKDEVLRAPLVGPGRDTLEQILQLISDGRTLDEFLAVKAAFERSTSLQEFFGQLHDVGFGKCLKPCGNYRSCPGCLYFVSGPEFVPNMVAEMVESFRTAILKVELKGGSVEDSLDDQFVRKDLLNVQVLQEYLEFLGIDQNRIRKCLREGAIAT